MGHSPSDELVRSFLDSREETGDGPAPRDLPNELDSKALEAARLGAKKLNEEKHIQPITVHFEGPYPDNNPKTAFGIKKVNLALNPPAALIYMALGFMDGAAKYGPYNWRENEVSAMIYVAALKRHLEAWLDGEEVAEDSGKPHLAHLLACAAILVDALETGNLVDDRPKPGAAAALLKKWTVE